MYAASYRASIRQAKSNPDRGVCTGCHCRDNPVPPGKKRVKGTLVRIDGVILGRLHGDYQPENSSAVPVTMHIARFRE